jgi:hypothetical protein
MWYFMTPARSMDFIPKRNAVTGCQADFVVIDARFK